MNGIHKYPGIIIIMYIGIIILILDFIKLTPLIHVIANTCMRPITHHNHHHNHAFTMNYSRERISNSAHFSSGSCLTRRAKPISEIMLLPMSCALHMHAFRKSRTDRSGIGTFGGSQFKKHGIFHSTISNFNSGLAGWVGWAN